MKKIAIPLLLAALMLATAWMVGIDPSSAKPGHKPVIPIIDPKNGAITVSSGSLTMKVSTGNANVLQGSDGRMPLQIQLDAVKAEIRERKPLNIALVIDRSGSMGEAGKLEYANQAALKLVDQLNKNDRLAIVIYDDVSEVLVPSTRVTNPDYIKSRISEITPRGSTNLHGGLALGYEEVNRNFDDEGINQIIILSDGLANQGLTDPAQLRQIVSAWGEKSIRVTAMGLGADFNEDLMMGLANASGGHYYFIESPTQTASIYERELNTLMQTVGKDVKVFINLADGVRLEDVAGYDVHANGSEIEIPLGAFNGGQQRVIIAHLAVPTGKIGKTDVAKVRLEYQDSLKDLKKINDMAAIDITCVTDVARVEENRNREVEGNVYWYGNTQENSAALDDIANGRKDEAVDWYERKAEEITQRNEALGGNAQLEAQAKQYRQEADKLKAAPSISPDQGRVLVKKGKELQRLQSLGYINQ